MTATAAQPHQVLCLEHESTSLYGEVIQWIAERNLYWVRPIALVYRDHSLEISSLYDLRQGADLLYPRSLFRVAIDTEVLPILMQLEMLRASQDVAFSDLAHQQLQTFIWQIWQAHRAAFQSVPSTAAIDFNPNHQTTTGKLP